MRIPQTATILAYWYNENVGDVPENTEHLWTVTDSGGDLEIDWNVKEHDCPTQKTLKSLEEDAIAWQEDRMAAKKTVEERLTALEEDVNILKQ